MLDVLLELNGMEEYVNLKALNADQDNIGMEKIVYNSLNNVLLIQFIGTENVSPNQVDAHQVLTLMALHVYLMCNVMEDKFGILDN
jgi:hypothetical protein